MDKIKVNALAFRELLPKEYYFCLSHKGKGFEVHLKFSINDFHHLEGFGQAQDLAIHSKSTEETFNDALNGNITQADLMKSRFYMSKYIAQKVDYLDLLEDAIDNNEMVFRLTKDSKGKTKIIAELFLRTDVNGNDIVVYIDRIDKRFSDYYCKSFVANPTSDVTYGNKELTLLWKEKINHATGKSIVQYQHDDFTPEDLNKPLN